MVFTFLLDISDLWRHLAIVFIISKIKPNFPFIGFSVKVWKSLLHGFDVYLVNQLICQNHEEDFFKLCVLLKKSEL